MSLYKEQAALQQSTCQRSNYTFRFFTLSLRLSTFRLPAFFLLPYPFNLLP